MSARCQLRVAGARFNLEGDGIITDTYCSRRRIHGDAKAHSGGTIATAMGTGFYSSRASDENTRLS
jgi:hypothetical protein